MSEDATTITPSEAAPRRRRWPRRAGLAVLALLTLLTAATVWLLGTGSGLRFVLARASGFTDGALSVQRASGRLAGHFELDGLRYHDAGGLDVRVSRVAATVAPTALLGLQLHLRRLQVGTVDVALPPPPPTQTSTDGLPDLAAPRPLRVDALEVGRVRIHRGDQTLFASNSLHLAARWRGHQLHVEHLRLSAPEGHAQLDADLALRAPIVGDLQGQFDWQLGQRRVTGTLKAHGTPARLQAQLRLRHPTASDLRVQLNQSAPYAWTASLRTPSFDPATLLGDARLRRAALRLDAHGTRHQLELQGEIDLDQHTLLLQPLRAHLTDGDATLVLDQLSVRSPKVPGQLDVQGQLALNASPVRGDLQAHWKDVTLPPDLVGQTLASSGQLSARGSVQGYQASGDFRLGPPQRQAQVTVQAAGTTQRVALSTLQVKENGGQLAMHGSIDLQPVVGWQIDARAQRFDPSIVAAGWTGKLDADLTSDGRLPKAGPQATLDLKKLGGTLRGKPLSGHGTLRLANAVLSGRVQLQSGGSRLDVDAPRGPRNAVHVRADIATLSEWLANAAGSLKLDAHVTGRWPGLALRARADAAGVRVAGQHAGELHATVKVPDLRLTAGDIELQAKALQLGGMDFSQLSASAHGANGRQRLQLEAKGSPLQLAMQIVGRGDAKQWQGQWQQLQLKIGDDTAWTLQQPAALSWNQGKAKLQQLCLHAGSPQLCLAVERARDGALKASYRLHQVPLGLLATLADGEPPVRATGTLDGQGNIDRSAGGRLTGHATLQSPSGELHYEGAKQPLLSYTKLDARAHLDGSQGRLTLAAALDHGGSLAGDVQVNGPAQALAGRLELHLRSLAFIELISHAVANIDGDADASITLGGTLTQPHLSGQARLKRFATEVPAAGLKLHDGTLSIDTDDARHFRIDGRVQSGKGALQVSGQAGIGRGDPLDIRIAGENVTVADLPSAQVAISPLLDVKRESDGLHVTGQVAFDEADIDLSKLPGAGAAKPSPDVVVVDAPQPAKSEPPVPIHSDVEVDLGSRTHLIGFGLNGKLSGKLRIREQPGKATTAQGQIAVDGTYRAYGQDLKIQQGRLLFASTPVDNPGLDIRAVRNLQPTATVDEGQVVGLKVSGTAQRPVLTVFSNPVMAQSDALSYLITGKPLSQVKGGEGSMVGAAAQALGSAAGDLLAKSVGSKLGIDDIGVSNNEALGGSSAFTVGKYLSPRLYLSYGVGLFEPGQVITLRYRLSHRWNVEAQNATGYSRAALNYRYEKKN